MDRYIDLHTHTTASDGSLSPAELVRHAKERGLSAIAITDHDSVDGVGEALAEGMKIDMEVVAGVEIGVEFKPEMHMLGYFFGDSYKNIKAKLNELRGNREKRNPKIIARLNEMGFDISYDEVLAEARGSVVGRPHIAKVLMNKGYVESVSEAFEKYLAYGKPAYFKKDKLTPKEGMEEILRAGGMPVLAHPMYLEMDEAELDELLGSMKADGLKGVEVYYVENTEEVTGILERLAEKHGLAATGGSDFHGRFKPDIELGTGRGNLRVPYKLLTELKGKV